MWIKLYDSAPRHPKVLGLSMDIGVTVPEAFGYLCTLWVWTLSVATDGDLSGHSPGVIEMGCGWSGEKGILFDALVGNGLLDVSGSSITVHDWWDYAGSNKEARRKQEQRKRKVSPDSHGTVTGQSANVPLQRRGEERRLEERGRGEQFKTSPPPLPDGVFTGGTPAPRHDLQPILHPVCEVTDEQQATIHSLRDYHAKLHGITPRGFIEGDDLERIALVLVEYGEDGCQKIIRTHHERCKCNPKTRRSFLSAFPHVAGDKKTPNWDWISELTSGTERDKAIAEW